MRTAQLACVLLPCLSMLFGAVDQGVPGSPEDFSSFTLEQLMQIKVEGAALHPQSLQDAPASVTILTANDIYKYGYRTLGEALASVRGFYATNDRTYRTVGLRGFSPPGDYASRILVLVNGHNMADNVFDSMLWFGVDFPIDMSLIKRIEIIRGPTSALYGSNGLFATVNVITKSPDEIESSLILTTGSFGEKKAQIMTAASIGKNGKALFSGSVFNNAGESPLYFSAFDTPVNNYGRAVRMDSEKGYHFFTNLIWRDWSITAALSDRNKIQPVSWGDTVFNDRGTQVMEPSNYVETAYTRERGGRTLRWRTYFSSTHLRGRFDYPLPAEDGFAVEDLRTCSCGDWIGSQLAYRFDVRHLGTLTAGAEGKIDLRVFQGAKDVSPLPAEYVNINRRDRFLGIFAQDELSLSDRWKLDLGIRFDASAYRRSFVSPRAALIYQASAKSTYKFLYGRAFRNPSAFHLFYEDGLTAMANPSLRPEEADTLEVNVERKIGKHISLLAAGYGYWLRQFLEGVYTGGGLLQYQNKGAIHARGFEVEVDGRPAAWLEASASYALQQTTDDETGAALANSPRHMAKLRFALPLGSKLRASSGMQYNSSRATLPGAAVGPVYLADFTLSSQRLLRNFDFRFGIRNAFDRDYGDPIALNSRLDRMRQAGRSFFVELIARAVE